MSVLSPQEIAELNHKLIEKGDKVVREEPLANGVYGTEVRKRIVEQWLEECEREQLETRFQHELQHRDQMFQERMQTEETRFSSPVGG